MPSHTDGANPGWDRCSTPPSRHPPQPPRAHPGEQALCHAGSLVLFPAVTIHDPERPGSLDHLPGGSTSDPIPHPWQTRTRASRGVSPREPPALVHPLLNFLQTQHFPPANSSGQCDPICSLELREPGARYTDVIRCTVTGGPSPRQSRHT